MDKYQTFSADFLANNAYSGKNSLQPLSFWEKLFSGPIFWFRGRSDYISWIRTDEAAKARQALKKAISKGGY